MRILASLDTRRAERRIDDLLDLARNGRAMYGAIGSAIANRIRLCFRLGVDPWGTPWAALRMRKGQPLRDTGRLQRSITSRPDSDGVTIGTNVRYGATHQFGAVINARPGGRLVFPGPNGAIVFAKRVRIPARRFLPIHSPGGTPDLPPAWTRAALAQVRAQLVAAWRKGDA